MELLTADHIPGFNDAIRAARVAQSTTMLADVHAAGGSIGTPRWRLTEFTIDERTAAIEVAKAIHRNIDRYVPEGEYVSLQRRPTPEELRESDGMIEWVTVMSDTPDEINDHAEMFAWAEGRCLIHGLGLGCVVHGLLARPDVTHVDVVEVDPEVIELTGRYLTDPRVTIHQGDCKTFQWPPGTRWNYVWHDIWSSIASYNLSDDEIAEHGVSYATMHRKFAGRCDYQFSWAFRRAQRMREVERRNERREAEFSRKWIEAQDPYVRVRMMAERSRKELGLPRSAAGDYMLMLWRAGELDRWWEAAERFDEDKYEEWKAKGEPHRGYRPNDLIRVAP